jgi:hypothetical protein
MISPRMSRPRDIEHGPRSRPLEASSPRRHHGAVRHAVPTPERTMTPVRHKTRALVGKAAIREHSPDDIQIRGNWTTGPPPRELHPLCNDPMA